MVKLLGGFHLCALRESFIGTPVICESVQDCNIQTAFTRVINDNSSAKHYFTLMETTGTSPTLQYMPPP